MQGRLTDQAAVAVAIARALSAGTVATVGHLLAGLATEGEGRAGRRLRERASAAALLTQRVAALPAPPLETALARACASAGRRAATTVDLLDAAIAAGGCDIDDLLASAGYQRDLDGWLAGDPQDNWFEDAETYGFQPHGDETLDRTASRVVAQVRAVDGGAVALLIAGSAAPDAALPGPDPRALAAVAARLRGSSDRWDSGLETVVQAARTLSDGPRVTVRDLLRAALVAGGDGPPLVLEFAGNEQ